MAENNCLALGIFRCRSFEKLQDFPYVLQSSVIEEQTIRCSNRQKVRRPISCK
jgi:hypothetical protein